MSLTHVQVGGHRGEELQDAEVLDSVPGWTVSPHHARCSECGGDCLLSETWLDCQDRLYCWRCLADAVLTDQRLAGVIMLGLLHLGAQEMRAVYARLERCPGCDCWFSGPAGATHCAPCRQRTRP